MRHLRVAGLFVIIVLAVVFVIALLLVLSPLLLLARGAYALAEKRRNRCGKCGSWWRAKISKRGYADYEGESLVLTKTCSKCGQVEVRWDDCAGLFVARGEWRVDKAA